MAGFTISRTFDAPPTSVFDLWTTPNRFERWFAPDGCDSRLLHADASPGGHYLQSDRWPDGSHFFMKHTFRQVDPAERLAFATSFCDEDGRVVKHPLAPSWPERMLTTVTFEEAGAGTNVTVLWEPLDPSAEEAAFFAGMLEKCHEGWAGTFDRLARTLDEPVAAVPSR